MPMGKRVYLDYYLNGAYMGHIDRHEASSIINDAQKKGSSVFHDFPDKGPESLRVVSQKLS